MSDRPSASAGVGPQPPTRAARQWALGTFTVLVLLAGSLGMLSHAGLWEPVELEAAELSRRIAGGLLGASAADATREDLPTRGELGRGELPFTSVALGFKLLGLSTWAGRLPLALWGLLGLLVLFWGTRRLVGGRVGWIAALVLGTTPLYFLQSRTLLGDITNLAAVSAAMTGLAVAVFDTRDLRGRAVGLGIGLVALGAAFLSRGLLHGVAVPLLGVGLAWLCTAVTRAPRDGVGALVGSASLVGGMLAIAFGAHAIAVTPPEHYSMLIGATATGVQPRTTFEGQLRDAAHALFPWSALAPFAAGRVLRLPPGLGEADASRHVGLRLTALATSGSALLVVSALAPIVGSIAFPAPAAVAVLIALSLHDFDEGAEPSRAWGLGVAALALVLAVDFKNLPEKLLVAFAVPAASFPQGFVPGSTSLLLVLTLVCAAVFVLLVQEHPPAAARTFVAADYARWPRTLRTLWGSNLLFAVLAVECALVCFELLLLLSERLFHFRAIDELGDVTRLGVRAGWLLVLCLCVAPLLSLAARDSVRVLVSLGAHLPSRWTRRGELRFLRGTVAAVLVSLCGVFLSLVQYPAILRQLTPNDAFDSYRRVARRGEPLGLLGTNAAAVRYQSGGTVQQWFSADAALDWLLATNERRFLVVRAKELAALNAAHRRRAPQRRNLPVVEAGRGELLLASNRLGPGELDQNPLAEVVLDGAPRPSRPMDAQLGSSLQVLGWDVLDEGRAPVNDISPNVSYRFVIYYRVLAPFDGAWETFVHVEGFQRRYNADHATAGGRYPFALWGVGDVIADAHGLELDSSFPAGVYQVFFGLFAGEQRLPVGRGPHEDNRVVAGDLRLTQ